MSPTSQKDLPISFSLDPGGGGDLTTVQLVIRPEDLTRSEPALLTAVQTFGGAFVDDFGPGVATIQISGHTGWGAGSRPDGAAAFQTLYDLIWTQYAAARAAAVTAGQSTDTVRLIFTDSLNDWTGVVAPGQFVLKRNRSRPLLMMYQIGMTVISTSLTDDLTDPLSLDIDGPNALDPSDLLTAGVANLQASASSLIGAIGNVTSVLPASLSGIASTFMAQTVGAIQGVVSSVASSTGGALSSLTNQLVGYTSDLASAGSGAFNSILATATLDTVQAGSVANIASTFSDISSTLATSFSSSVSYPDYSGLAGASGGSDLVGGDPQNQISGNSFDAVTDDSGNGPAVAPATQNAINALASTDPVNGPMSLTAVANNLLTVISAQASAYVDTSGGAPPAPPPGAGMAGGAMVPFSSVVAISNDLGTIYYANGTYAATTHGETLSPYLQSLVLPPGSNVQDAIANAQATGVV